MQCTLPPGMNVLDILPNRGFSVHYKDLDTTHSGSPASQAALEDTPQNGVQNRIWGDQEESGLERGWKWEIKMWKLFKTRPRVRGMTWSPGRCTTRPPPSSWRWCPITHRGRRSRRSHLCPADQRWTCLSHSSDSSKFHFRCLGSHRGYDVTLSGNGIVPGLVRPLQGATVPTGPSKSHLHREDFKSQHFTLKGTSFWMALFPWWIEGIKIQNLSVDACLPGSHRTLNLMTARESDSLTTKLGKF